VFILVTVATSSAVNTILYEVAWTVNCKLYCVQVYWAIGPLIL